MKKRRQMAAFSLFAFQDIITSICGIVVLITLILSLELSLRVVSNAIGNEAYESRQKYNELVKAATVLENNIEALQTELTSVSESVESEVFELTQSQMEEQNARLIVSIAANRQNLEELENAVARSEKQLKDARLLEVEIDRIRQKKSKLEEDKKELSVKDRELVAEEKELQEQKGLYYGRSHNMKRRPWLADISLDRVVIHSLSANDPGGNTEFSGSESQIVKAFESWSRRLDTSVEYVIFVVRPSGKAVYNHLKRDLPYGLRFGVDLIGETEVLGIVP